MSLETRLFHVLEQLAAPDGDVAGSTLSVRATKKNYTESVSQLFTAEVAAYLEELGLKGVRAPRRGPDKQFMGGYGPKGVDVYLSDEKHGLLLASGTKGILYNVRKNLKNRYRDMVMEALELHKRFPYAVCGHLLFLDAEDAARPSRAFGTVMGEAVALLSGISGRERPDEAPEVYETMGLLTFRPGVADSLDLRPPGVPLGLQAAEYCDRLARAFWARNPFFLGGS